MSLIKMRALKRLSFRKGSNVVFVEKGEYFDAEESQVGKLLKLQAVEIVGEETVSGSDDGQGYEDIGELIEKLETFKNKASLLEFGNKLGIQELTEDMKMAEIKDAIINVLEERADKNDL